MFRFLLAFVSLASILLLATVGQPLTSCQVEPTAVTSDRIATSHDTVTAPKLEVDSEDPGVRHSRLQLIWALVARFWSWAVLAAILFAGLSPRLRDVAAVLTGNRLGSVAPYLVLLTILLAVLSLPIACYRGFVIEHDFGLSNQTIGEWLADTGKSLGLTLVSNLMLFWPIYLFIRRSPTRWWLYSAGLAVALVVIATALAPVVIAPLFNKFEPLQDQALKEKILTLTDRGGIKAADVLQVDMSRQTKAANAYFTGIGPTQRIVLSDTLLANFSPDEILTVVAHETGHQAHNDLWRGIGVGVVFVLIGAYVLYRAAYLAVARLGSTFGFRRLEDAASIPLLFLLLGLISFLAQPAQNTFSRYVEHQADVYALELTQDGEAYASALKKFGELNLSDPNPPEWIEFAFYSHPSLKKRIELAQTYPTRRASLPLEPYVLESEPCLPSDCKK